MVDKNTYKFYMSRFIDGSWETDISLEDYFDGMRYSRCEGLSSKGKIKNIYTESYAEHDGVRLFIPENPRRESTDVVFTFLFTGDSRRDVYDSFVEWLSGYRVRYWDTCRNRELEFILIEAIEPDQDMLYGSIPYISAEFKCKNIKGSTTKRNVEVTL